MHHLTVTTEMLRLLKARPLSDFGLCKQEHILNRCPHLAANHLSPIATNKVNGDQIVRSWFEVYAVTAGLDSVFALHHKLQTISRSWLLVLVPVLFEGQQLNCFRFQAELLVNDDTRDAVFNELRAVDEMLTEFAHSFGERNGSL